jgi:hypothetical protein
MGYVAIMASGFVQLWSIFLLVSIGLFVLRYTTGYNLFLHEVMTLVQWIVGVVFVSSPILFSREPLKSTVIGALICMTFGILTTLGYQQCSYCPFAFRDFAPSRIADMQQSELMFYVFRYHTDSMSLYLGTIITFGGLILLFLSIIVYQHLWVRQHVMNLDLDTAA